MFCCRSWVRRAGISLFGDSAQPAGTIAVEGFERANELAVKAGFVLADGETASGIHGFEGRAGTLGRVSVRGNGSAKTMVRAIDDGAADDGTFQAHSSKLTPACEDCLGDEDGFYFSFW